MGDSNAYTNISSEGGGKYQHNYKQVTFNRNRTEYPHYQGTLQSYTQ